MNIGDRVEIPSHTEAWMQGDKYGTVVKIAKFVHVEMDISKRVLKFRANTLTAA